MRFSILAFVATGVVAELTSKVNVKFHLWGCPDECKWSETKTLEGVTQCDAAVSSDPNSYCVAVFWYTVSGSETPSTTATCTKTLSNTDETTHVSYILPSLYAAPGTYQRGSDSVTVTLSTAVAKECVITQYEPQAVIPSPNPTCGADTTRPTGQVVTVPANTATFTLPIATVFDVVHFKVSTKACSEALLKASYALDNSEFFTMVTGKYIQDIVQSDNASPTVLCGLLTLIVITLHLW
eukprot:Blabericola_migrator_1__3261@NODE_195_length_11539_cov_221_635547_g168_i0_p5_GENE_NODE_195_length_11539_cov_221_635547_g168_i0NODE_195_length_11539_cov_221_635547_g168_i0_p5_ORF_typecomplete_len239_score41_31P2_N/PF18628_1/0_091_NODE_195_length_11539_cov_221_635547_g168_i035764292